MVNAFRALIRRANTLIHQDEFPNQETKGQVGALLRDNRALLMAFMTAEPSDDQLEEVQKILITIDEAEHGRLN